MRVRAGFVKAAVMRGVNDPLSIEEVDIGRPQSNEILIDVRATGLCHSDLKMLEGAFPMRLPAILGHESAGVVREVGTDVVGVTPGDRVITSLSVSCRSCLLCTSGRPHLCPNKEATRRRGDQPPRLSLGGLPVTQGFDLSSFASQMLVHESAVVRLDDAMPFDRAALLGCGVATGLGAVFNRAEVQPGDSVAVLGCGGVGLAAVQAARIAGARQVIAVDRVLAKLEMARSLGATHVVDSSRGDAVEAVVEIADGLGVDHAIEAVGGLATVVDAFSMTRRGGTATVIGLIPAGSTIPVSADELFYERRLQSSVMGSGDFLVDTPRYVRMYLDGILDLDSLVTGRIPLESINDGFDLMRSGVTARTVITFEAGG